MHTLKTETGTPLYQQIYVELRGMIERGDYLPGQQIPTENVLTEQFGVSRITIRNAVKKLVDDKFLTRCHGKGTFVAFVPKIESFSAGGSFTESCMQLNIKPETEILYREYEKAGSGIASQLRVSEGEIITCIKRLRKADGMPVIYEVDYLPGKFDFPRGDDNMSLIEVVRRVNGVLRLQFDDTIDIAFADKDQAESLDCSVCAPLLHVFERVKGQNGRVLYCNHQYIASERYKFAVRRSAT